MECGGVRGGMECRGDKGGMDAQIEAKYWK
jgi:hypothetical protein